MRFLHTADWHLGRQIRGKSRASEFAAVLDQIVEIATSEEVDAVLVAGDIWDTASPSPEADRLLYDALRSLIQRDIEVLLVSGNHDNPRRLEAIGRLAEMLKVQTRGYIRPPGQGGIVTIERGGERAEIAAIPWVPEGRALDALEILEDFEATSHKYEDAVEEIYRQLAAGFTPGAIHLMVGHLFVDGALLANVDGSERRLHIEQSYGVKASRLPSTPQYIALGHIHQPQVIVDAPNGAAAYGGSILQLDFGEIGQQKVVRIIDAAPGRPVAQHTVPLTAGLPLLQLRGSLAEVLKAGETVGAAHLRVVLDVDRPEPGLAQRVRDALPGAVDVRLDYDRSDEEGGDVDFADLAPEELFVRYYQRQHGTAPAEDLLGLFRELVSEAVGAS
ncbi:MAG: exonuclease SbcCD subunit D [Chloroflexi bacterium]|nr:exonuclease SbcCD subunit D [Chloroflexota bacterium]MDA1145865.1 exonuclease SbcCD subunit D [Chloroflexota bacterium]